MDNVQEQMERLNQVRKKAEEVDREKSRISGELGSHKKRQEELSEKCKKDFDCKVDELPGLVKDLEEQAEKSLEQAEIVLGIKEGEVKSVKTESKPEPKKEKSEVEKALDGEEEEEYDDEAFIDQDSLI